MHCTSCSHSFPSTRFHNFVVPRLLLSFSTLLHSRHASHCLHQCLPSIILYFSLNLPPSSFHSLSAKSVASSFHLAVFPPPMPTPCAFHAVHVVTFLPDDSRTPCIWCFSYSHDSSVPPADLHDSSDAYHASGISHPVILVSAGECPLKIAMLFSCMASDCKKMILIQLMQVSAGGSLGTPGQATLSYCIGSASAVVVCAQQGGSALSCGPSRSPCKNRSAL